MKELRDILISLFLFLYLAFVWYGVYHIVVELDRSSWWILVGLMISTISVSTSKKEEDEKI